MNDAPADTIPAPPESAVRLSPVAVAAPREVTRARTCQVGVRCPGDELDDVQPCADLAPYLAIDWGHGPGREETACCSHHAWDAITDGARVEGPSGHRCRLDEDGQIYEAAS
jgi:hypothetical protein